MRLIDRLLGRSEPAYNRHLERPDDLNIYGQRSVAEGKVGNGGWIAGRCFYCGSMTCEDFVAACEGTVEVADWKYGFPHKAYVHEPSWGKFYFVHLAGWDGLEAASPVIAMATGLHFEMDGDRLLYRAATFGDIE